MKKTALVTGATGFLGRWLIRELLQEDYSVTAIVRPGSRNLSFLPKNDQLKIVECPMECYDTLKDKVQAKAGGIFYHLAWDGVSGQNRMELAVQQRNIEAAMDAVRAAVQLGCTCYVGLGSIMELEAIGAAEQDGITPGMGYIYGEAKHFSHLATKALAGQLGIAHLWPVLTNAYGEFEYAPRFINTTLRKILRCEPLEFTAGTQMYDFIYVRDAVRALIAVGERGIPYHSYLIGSGQAAPLRTFIERIGRLLAPEQELLFGNVPYSGVQLPAECYSTEKLFKDTGFLPEVSFEDGLLRTMEWLRKEEHV